MIFYLTFSNEASQMLSHCGLWIFFIQAHCSLRKNVGRGMVKRLWLPMKGIAMQQRNNFGGRNGES